MFRKSAKQKRLEYLSKFMTNGYVYALIDSDGEIKATYRYKYETNKARKLKGQAIVMLKELFYKALENDS
ncbi:TPA: hypothetical protein JD053_06225 [Klebsiella michiganensis]|uniref:hypothetical protein n=1 Tax=Enterobacterales TaxID=91347 RepID=UPI0005ECB35B|nr:MULTISPECIES: hypothetical protein [Enterobacteriaceae]EDF6232638.1 hypothetical protein [Salmonella enterica subsp. enterica serovar Senftenberg]EIY9027985.1 hypothetical protein [Salmonella enterica]EKY3945877.1 hypothetical protein [Enterobacter hormaechei]MDE1513051.1 hypothetical protein [Serratia nevei]HCL6053431.1 hypothetical protein [Raoultella ornithinolytica]HCM5085320.1 hypothetical protein [Klebsiella aerogenes]HDU3837831.1 hypothetical protein [Klebsiella pneumoniae subsp. p